MDDGQLYISYIPQWKKFLMWHEFTEGHSDESTTAAFRLYEDAVSFINEVTRMSGREKYTVVKEFSEQEV